VENLLILQTTRHNAGWSIRRRWDLLQ